MDIDNVIIRFVMTEKALRLVEKENKLVMIVDRRSNKTLIKQAVEKLFNVKVEKVNTMILPTGEKKAYVKLDKNYKASDVLSKIGLM